MNFIAKNLDLVIIATFLCINLVLGVMSGRGIKTLKEYAIGNRNFSTAAITATIIATWISGSFFAIGISEIYKDGVWFFVACLGNIADLLIIAFIFSPRVREFFGALSVAEVMGNLYGPKIRTITAVSSIVQSIGMTALQIKVFSNVFGHFLGTSSEYTTLASSIVVITYASFGGIKSVTLTDFIQGLTFSVFIPVLTFFVWKIFGRPELLISTIENNSIFHYKELINIDNPKFIPYFFLFLWYATPSLNPAMLQRILMSKDTTQIRNAFATSAAVIALLYIMTSFMGFVVFSHNPDLDPTKIATYVIDACSNPGVKGLALIGIMAMVMSTADSWINAGAVIFAHDLCKPLGLILKNELLLPRLYSVIVGIGAVVLALNATNLLKLLVLTFSFYMPIVSVPLILAICGFRSSSRAALIGMLFGLFTVLIWKFSGIETQSGINDIIPAMVANLVTFMLSHYLLKEPGGWVGISKHSLPVIAKRTIHNNSTKRLSNRLGK